jgi:hypothetical protein
VARSRLSAVLVLDVSRSMQGEPMAQVLCSARRVAEVLEDNLKSSRVDFVLR